MHTINCKGHLTKMDVPLVMGIINTTSDSFFAGSRHASVSLVLKSAEKMLMDGATILDIGGQSTRPGHISHAEDHEINSVIPAIEAINKHFPDTLISVDTYRSKVASLACDAGASIVNDISGGYDPDMFGIVAQKKAVYILMHLNGTPDTMHQPHEYQHIITDIIKYFVQKIDLCKQVGIKDIILDIGIGFSKSIEENFFLLKNLECFKMLDKPLLVGLSRKSFIYKSLGITTDEALTGTTALNFHTLNKGANIIRVHDVKEAAELVKLNNFLYK